METEDNYLQLDKIPVDTIIIFFNEHSKTYKRDIEDRTKMNQQERNFFHYQTS